MNNFIRWIIEKNTKFLDINKLIKNGLTVGKEFNYRADCIIDSSHCWLITIGDNVTLAPKVHILAHDASTKNGIGYTKIGLVNIGNNVFIGANTTILPNVTIGDNCIIGAGCVITKKIVGNSVVVGNPAQIICTYDEYITKNKLLMKNSPIYDLRWTINSKELTKEMKEKMKVDLIAGIGFIK
ncbi:MAG: DapH/DapD/GlmU-related protein [Clostridia bacterium]|nr:DapH/DapD/GlmU-related protein [Clostridia bacterium]MDD4387167.1 DapH/DapD/GlmU-related protein [Clostridia bacterium]